MPNVFVWTDIPVLDLDRAIGFYSAVIGQEVVKQTFPGFEFGLLPDSDKAVSGTLFVSDTNKPSEFGPLVYLNVEGRHDAAGEAITANGGAIIMPKHMIGPHGFRTVFLDTEGNKLALHSITE